MTTVTGPSFVSVGNVLIDHTYHLTNFPEPDGGAYIRSAERRLGGVENNVATLVAGLGHSSGLVGRLGTDDEAKAVHELLDGSPVETTHLHEVPEVTTSYCLVLIDPQGRRTILGGGDSTLQLSLRDQERAYVDDAAVAFTTAYSPASVADAIGASSTPLVYDLAGEFADLNQRGLDRATLGDLASSIDWFIGNERAIRSYLETTASPRALIDELRERGFDRGAITRGEAGASLFDHAEIVEIPAFDVDVVDETGAGDAFTAGLIHGVYFADLNLERAGRFAAAMAARNCTVSGANDSPPTRDEVLDLLASSG